jgi:hypothetical protein
MEDWYKVSVEDIHRHGGGKLLSGKYDNSPCKALQAVFPEYPWMPWRFLRIPPGYWESASFDADEKRRLLTWLGEKISIKSLEDWYRISVQQIRTIAPLRILQNPVSFTEILRSAYPEYSWDVEKLKRSVRAKASQRLAATALRELFPKYGTESSIISGF